MTPEELQSRISKFPRLRFGRYPTPIQPLNRVSKQTEGPRLWIKRDDDIGPGIGGNKGRKLEFLMADALRRKKRKVVTYGGLQSNHTQMTSAACAKLGIEAHLFFFDRRPANLEGNLLLAELLGAKMHFIPFGGGGDGSMSIETTNRLVRLVSAVLIGPRAYFIPVGGHSLIGCLGYVDAAREIHEQVGAQGLDPWKVTVVTAVGSGGTLAGLMAGFSLIHSPIKLLGVDVEKLWKSFPDSLARLAGDLCGMLSEPREFRARDVPLIQAVDGGYKTGFSGETTAVIHRVARTEGILLDPIFTGRAFMELMRLAGRSAQDENIIFIHTGGLPGLWANADLVRGA